MKSLGSVGTAIPVVMPSSEEKCDGCLWLGPAPPTPVPLRIIRPAELDTRRKGVRETVLAALSAEEWEFLCGVNKLKLGVEQQDELAIQTAYKLLSPRMAQEAGSKIGRLPADVVKSHIEALRKFDMLLDEVSRWVTDALSRVRVICWLAGKPGTRQRPGVALFCPDFKTAVTTKMLLHDAVRECAHCGAPFVVKRPKQQCCTHKCVSAHRYARWVARQEKKTGG